MPFGTEYTGYRRRYVLTATGSSTYYSIGLRPPPKGGVETPIWLRFHSETPGFDEVRKAMSRPEQALDVIEEGGHLFYGLIPPIDVEGSPLIADLADQANRVLQAAGWTAS